MKHDELQLAKRVVALHGGPYNDHKCGEFLDAIAETLGIPPKRALFIGEKWTRRGVWDYGVSVRAGWLTPDGFATLSSLPDVGKAA